MLTVPGLGTPVQTRGDDPGPCPPDLCRRSHTGAQPSWDAPSVRPSALPVRPSALPASLAYRRAHPGARIARGQGLPL